MKLARLIFHIAGLLGVSALLQTPGSGSGYLFGESHECHVSSAQEQTVNGDQLNGTTLLPVHFTPLCEPEGPDDDSQHSPSYSNCTSAIQNSNSILEPSVTVRRTYVPLYILFHSWKHFLG